MGGFVRWKFVALGCAGVEGLGASVAMKSRSLFFPELRGVPIKTR